VEIVQVLVNHGADRNAALRQGSHQIIQYLLDTGSQVDRSIGTFTRPNHDYVYRLAFSPDGKVLAMASNRNGTFLDVATMKERHLSLDYAGSSVAFSPDSALVATISFISNDSIGLWNATTGRNLGVLYVHNSKINDIVFSPDYKLLASGSKDGTVRFWDISVFAPGTTSNVPKKSPTLLRTFSNHTDRVMVVAFSPTGNLFASYSGDGMVRFWDTNSMMEAGYELWCPVLARDHFTRPALMFSSDGKQLLSASSYGLVKLWDVATGDGRLLLNDDADNIRAVAFSPDCKLVATGYVDGKIRLLDVASGQMRRVLECHTGRVFSIAFAPDGKLASVSADGTVRFWLTC
jgi:Tol biopolymer transport system component